MPIISKIFIIVVFVTLEACAVPSLKEMDDSSIMWMAVVSLSIVGIFALYITSGQVEEISKKYETIEQYAKESKAKQDVVLNVINERLKNSTIGIQRHREFIEELAADNPDLQILQSEANRVKRDENILQEAIKDLEHFKAIQSGTYSLANEKFDLNDLKERLIKIIKPYFLVKGNEFECIIDPNLPTQYNGDMLQIEQILRTIAVEMANDIFDATISLTITKSDNDEESLQFSFTSDYKTDMDNFGYFDGESGIDESSQSIRMLKNYMAKELIDLMGGSLKIEQFEKNTVCNLTLPVKPLV